MPRKSQRVAYLLTFLLKKEGDLWASLVPEMDVASCGDSMEHAREMLMEAIRAHYATVLEKGWLDTLWRPVSAKDVEDFKTDPPGEVVTESYVMVVRTSKEPGRGRRGGRVRIEFIPTAATAAHLGTSAPV